MRQPVVHSFVLIMMLRLTQIQGSQCDTGWFGSQCQYKCHCTDNKCDNNGECTISSKCDIGWFGPQCQYADLVATKSKSPTPFWLSDLDDSTCNDVTDSQSLTVKLDQPYPFTWLRLVVRNADQLHGVSVLFSNTQSDTVKDCINQRTAVVNSQTLDIHCDVDMSVDQMIFTGEGVKYLCTVYISGGRNVALRQNTTQSSTADYGHSGPELAVDGNTDRNWYKQSCTHTKDKGLDPDPRWSVTLTQPQIVNRYMLYNRLDDTNDKKCCPERLKGFILDSYTTNGTKVFEYQDTKEYAWLVYTVTAASAPVSVVSIQATFVQEVKDKYNATILTLCEVEIYGDSDCEPGRYGRECEHMCNCAEVKESCFISTGGCPAGCAQGYKGENCQQKESKPAQDDANDEDSDTIVPVAAGIAAALVVIVVAVVVGVCCYFRRRSQRRPTPPGYDDVVMAGQDDHTYRDLYKTADNYNLPRDAPLDCAILGQDTASPQSQCQIDTTERHYSNTDNDAISTDVVNHEEDKRKAEGDNENGEEEEEAMDGGVDNAGYYANC